MRISAVQRQRRRAGDLRQPAGGVAAHQLHLEHPVARVHEAERGGGVQVVGGADARDAVGVEGRYRPGRTGRGCGRPGWSGGRVSHSAPPTSAASKSSRKPRAERTWARARSRVRIAAECRAMGAKGKRREMTRRRSAAGPAREQPLTSENRPGENRPGKIGQTKICQTKIGQRKSAGIFPDWRPPWFAVRHAQIRLESVSSLRHVLPAMM